MKYTLMMRARTVYSESIDQKHNQFISAISRKENPWGLVHVNESSIKPPNIGSDLCIDVKLNKFLPKGIKGHICYTYRGGLRDEGMCDDWVALDFNPQKIDYVSFLKEGLNLYIGAFRPYLAYIQDEQFIYVDAQAYQKSYINTRNTIYRINPIGFFDRELCKRTFSLSPEEILYRISKYVEHASLEFDGIFFIYSSKILSMEESDQFNKQMKSLLTKSTPNDEKT